MTIWNTPLSEKADDYLVQRSQFDNSLLEFVYDSAYQFDEPHMQVSRLQATCLQFIVKSNKVSRIVEVGTFVGFSAFAMALAVDKANESRITSIEINPQFHRQARHNLDDVLQLPENEKVKFGAVSSVELLRGDAKEILGNDHSNADLFFLDGDKMHYSFYLDWAIKNLRTESLFVVDNVLFKGGVLDRSSGYAKSIRKMTEELKDSGAFDFCFFPVGDCMLIAKKR